MDSQGQSTAHESLPLDKIARVLELSDELQKIIFHPDQTIFNRIAFGVAELLYAESCGIFLRSGAETLRLEADYSEKRGFDFEPVEVRIESVLGSSLTGHIAAQGQIVSLSAADLRDHPYRKKDGSGPKHLVSGICESYLAIPLKDRKGRLLGLLTAHNKKENLPEPEGGWAPFTGIDRTIGRMLAGRIVPVLETHRLVRAFREITQQVYTARGLPEVLAEVQRQTTELLAADSCEVFHSWYGNEHAPSGAGRTFLSEIFCPLGLGERTLGGITAKALHAGAFDQQDLEILRLLAEQATAAIETVQREERFRTAVKEVARAATVPEGTLDLILEGARDYGLDAGVIYIADHREQKLRLRKAFGCTVSPEILKVFNHTFQSDSFAGKVFRRGTSYSHKPWVDPDVNKDGLRTFDIHSSLVGTPMLYKGETVGVLVCWTRERPPIPENNQRVLDHYAGLAGQLLGLAQIEEQRSRDLREIISILESMHSEPSVAHHIPLILDCLRRRYFDRVRYYIWAEPTKEFLGVHSVGMEPVRFSGHRISVADSKHARDIYEWALKSKSAKEYQPGTPEIDTQAGPLGKNPELPFAIVPLVVNGEVFGTIVADNTPTGRKITPDALTFLSQMGALASQLIANARNHDNFMVETFHMVRAPAHSVQFLLDTILARPWERTENEKALRDAHEESLRLASLTRALGRVVGDSSKRSPESLRDLVQISLQRFAPVAQNLGVRLVAEWDEAKSYPVVVDRDRILVVLDSLLENAMAFSDSGTTIKLTLTADGGRFRVSIIDEGPGVPLEWRQRIFKMGQSRPPEGKPAGTGVGLPIARRIVEAHGGKLEHLVPESGKGACFCFMLNEFPENADKEGERG